ncbi:unnamed protein product [Mytilus coruscus]|uniref:Ubiquitin-like protease family profile domain-containing protein n=1 Tax=Mytilus coruscus TaxID=42192 RepID=A0A6J8C5P4_MYTCO|nr:unnamed protein product [Mytilus coruscus]
MKNSIYGVFASDEITNFILKPMTGLIANTDVKLLPGRHWVAFFLNENAILEVFDSYGSSMNHLSAYFKHFMKSFPKIKINEKQFQGQETTVCGQYCLFYLMSRVRGHSMEKILNIFGSYYNSNDHFVYNVIDEQFHCCMTFSNNYCQSCTSCK